MDKDDLAGASKVAGKTPHLPVVAWFRPSKYGSDGISFQSKPPPSMLPECEPLVRLSDALAALGAASPFAHVAPETDQQNHPAQTAGQPAAQAEPTEATLWAMAQALYRSTRGDWQAGSEEMRAVYAAAQAGAVQPAAPAVPVAYLYTARKPGTQSVFASVDERDPLHWPYDRNGWVEETRTPLGAIGDPVVTWPRAALRDEEAAQALGAPDHAGTAPKAAEPPAGLSSEDTTP